MTVSAYDTTITVSTVSLNRVNDMLQQELMSFSEWVVQNKLKLNVLKTKCMLLGSKQRKNPKFHMSLWNHPIEQVKAAKLLGSTFEQTMSWTTNINNTVNEMSRNM